MDNLGNIPMPASQTFTAVSSKLSPTSDSDPENNASPSKFDSPLNKSSSKHRLQAFTLQKKTLESSSSTLISTAGKNTGKSIVSQNPVLIGKKTHGTITKMATYIPTETPETTQKPKPKPKVVKKVPQQLEILQANIEMQTRREQLMTLVELGIPLGMIPISSSAQGAKAMPTKGMPPIKGLLEPEEVDKLLNGELTAKSKNIVEKIFLFKNCATEPLNPRDNRDFRSKWKKREYQENRSFREMENKRYDNYKRDRRPRHSPSERREYSNRSMSHHSKNVKRQPSVDRKSDKHTRSEKNIRDDKNTRGEKNIRDDKNKRYDKNIKDEKNESVSKQETNTVTSNISEKGIDSDKNRNNEKNTSTEKPKFTPVKDQLAIEEKIKDLNVICENVSKTEIPDENIDVTAEQKIITEKEISDEYYRSFRKDSFLPVDKVKTFETIDFLTNIQKKEKRGIEDVQTFDLSSNTDTVTNSMKTDDSTVDYYSPGRESSKSSSTIENTNLSDDEISVCTEVNKIENVVFDNDLSWENITKCNLPISHINPKCIRETTSANKIYYCESTKNCGCQSEKRTFFKGFANKIIDTLSQTTLEEYICPENENKTRSWYPKHSKFLVCLLESKEVDVRKSVSHLVSNLKDVNISSTDKFNQTIQQKTNTKGICVQLNDFDIVPNIESLDKEYEKFMEAVCPDGSVSLENDDQYTHPSVVDMLSEEKGSSHKMTETNFNDEAARKSNENIMADFVENNFKEMETTMKKTKKSNSKKKIEEKSSGHSSDSTSDDSSSSFSSTSSSYSSSSSSSLLSDLITSSSESESSSSSDSSAVLNKKKWKAKRKKKLKKKLARKIAQKLKKQKKKILALKKFKKKQKAERRKSLKENSIANEKNILEDNILKGVGDESSEFSTKEKIKMLKKQKKKKEKQKKMKKKLFKKLIESSSNSSTSESESSDSEKNSGKNQNSPKKMLVKKIISEHQLSSENFSDKSSSIQKEIFCEDETKIKIIDKPTIIRKHFNSQIINVTELESDFMVNNFQTEEIKIENINFNLVKNNSIHIHEDKKPAKHMDISTNNLLKGEEWLEHTEESVYLGTEEEKIKTANSHKSVDLNQEIIIPLNDIRPIPTISDVRNYQQEDNAQVPDDTAWDWPLSDNTLVSSKGYKKEEWEMSENVFHNPPTLVEVPLSDITETNYVTKSKNAVTTENCYNNQNSIKKNNSKGYYNIETISSNAMGRLDYDYNTNDYTNNENYSESYLDYIDESIIEKRNNQKISLDDRINMVLQCTSVKKDDIENYDKEDDEEDDDEDADSESKNIPVIHLAPSPDKGILLNIDAQIVRRNKNSKPKSVSFADGFAPGQDSDIEDDFAVPKKKKKLNSEDKQKKSHGGHAYPCPPSWPDYSDPWDTLPPPPPPPGSPPPHLKYYCVQDTIVPLPLATNRLETVS